MDIDATEQENQVMREPGGSRRRIARRLNAAYAGGLLSDDTFTHRLDDLLGSRLVDPRNLVGDLNLRGASRWWVRVRMHLRTQVARVTESGASSAMLLALDWSGANAELMVGRHDACDVVLDHPTVSRQHARLLFRDGKWIVHDLRSTNGTSVNGIPVGRCELRPGDRLALGEEQLRID